MRKTDDLRIKQIKAVASPSVICEAIPMTEAAANTTLSARAAIHEILTGNDDRLLVVVGPCSIHDIDAAKEYASRLRTLVHQHRHDLLIIMRVYFEKPRTTVGWKGLINDPDLDNSFNINEGLRLARQLLVDLNEMGVAAGTEYLDLITPQYVADLISWGAIGARTTESQAHRELASGLSCPVGFKNGTNGATKIAVDAISAAIKPHHFLSLNKAGSVSIFSTQGNPDCHIILRGGKTPNYDAENIAQVSEELLAANIQPNVMVDLSHANSNKQYEKQIEVGESVADQIATGNKKIIGIMIESHLVAGKQDVQAGQKLVYGQSITDACLDWDNTANLIQTLATAAIVRREKNK